MTFALNRLREAGHDVVSTGDWTTDPWDQEILKYAYDQERILVTLDKDFGERAIVFGEPHRGIIRLVGIAARRQADYCLHTLSKYGNDLASGAIITVEESRARIRTPDRLSRFAWMGLRWKRKEENGIAIA